MPSLLRRQSKTCSISLSLPPWQNSAYCPAIVAEIKGWYAACKEVPDGCYAVHSDQTPHLF